jgi:hypothetical protein
MQRQPSCCDFCGFPEVSQEYPTDTDGISWYACLECARLVSCPIGSRHKLETCAALVRCA